MYPSFFRMVSFLNHINLFNVFFLYCSYAFSFPFLLLYWVPNSNRFQNCTIGIYVKFSYSNLSLFVSKPLSHYLFLIHARSLSSSPLSPSLSHRWGFYVWINRSLSLWSFLSCHFSCSHLLFVMSILLPLPLSPFSFSLPTLLKHEEKKNLFVIIESMINLVAPI